MLKTTPANDHKTYHQALDQVIENLLFLREDGIEIKDSTILTVIESHLAPVKLSMLDAAKYTLKRANK